MQNHKMRGLNGLGGGNVNRARQRQRGTGKVQRDVSKEQEQSGKVYWSQQAKP